MQMRLQRARHLARRLPQYKILNINMKNCHYEETEYRTAPMELYIKSFPMLLCKKYCFYDIKGNASILQNTGFPVRRTGGFGSFDHFRARI